MAWWRKREEQLGGEVAAADPTLPVIRLEHNDVHVIQSGFTNLQLPIQVHQRQQLAAQTMDGSPMHVLDSFLRLFSFQTH